MSRDGASTLVVAFEDIDRLSRSVRAHSDFVRSRIGHVARVASDPDLVASLAISPITGAQAEGAVALAASRLVVHATAAESVAVLSATVVTTYRLAEDSLAIAAAGLGEASGAAGAFVTRAGDSAITGLVVSGSIAVLYGSALIGVKVAVDSLVAGFGDEFVDSLVPGLLKTLEEYRDSPALLIGGGALFGAHFGANIASEFEMNDVFARAILRVESSLGATGPFYDDILRAVIASGNTFGFFIDRPAELGPSGLADGQLAELAEERAVRSSRAIFGLDRGFNVDKDGRIVPSDITSLFASGRQIDDVGKDHFATIRILTCTDDDGLILGYTVQIPSTQSAYPWRSAAPNDLTADLHAMLAENQTALGDAVLEAMNEAGITPGPDGPPILISGFSLGGITAASIAASDTGYHIQQVITAGSPIARFDIPNDIGVVAWEANQDLVCASDGRANPSRWTTIRQDALNLAGEGSIDLGPHNAHDLDRYARMAAENPQVGANPKISMFFDGNLTITDYFAKNSEGD